MPFDSALPANGAPLVSAEMRGQLNGLKDLIDALPAINTAVVDSVSTGNPNDPASVMLGVSGGTLHFSFILPRGNDGSNGVNGSDGNAGPPFTNFIIDGVTTLNPGQPATAQAVFDGSAVRLLFGLPCGQDGTNGTNGSDGGQGAPGAPFTNFVIDGVITLNPGDLATVNATFDGSAVRLVFGIPRGNDGSQGTPGEVTNAQLSSAISGTSSNSNAVSTLSFGAAPDYDAAQQQEIIAKINELISALRR